MRSGIALSGIKGPLFAARPFPCAAREKRKRLDPLSVCEMMSDGLVSLNGDGFSFVGMVKSLTAAKGDGTPHTLAVLIPEEDYNLAVAKNIMQTVLLSALLLFCAVVCCLYLARRYLAPVHRDLDRLRDENRAGAGSGE